jgi:uncharacterized Ntn-hydrolase superfamily protein
MALLHTFSIVARDKETGDLGVAVQTHWFAVGALCPWVEAGTGAVATQSMVEVSYGPKSLEYLRSGKTPREALDLQIAADENSDQRQVAIINHKGKIAVHTGSRCIREAGHFVGEGYTVQANMMLNNSIWPAMAEAFEKTSGDLSWRMLSALKAGQAAGGDIRGIQSAALLVADNQKSNEPWKHVKVDIRIDDHSDPIGELERLLSIHSAYEQMNKGDDYLSKGNFKAAGEAYQQAYKLNPGNDEVPFWHAVSLIEADRLEEALPLFESIFRKDPNWYELVKRLPECGLMKKDPIILKRISDIRHPISDEEK